MIKIESDLACIDGLIDRIAWFLAQDVLEMNIDGQKIRGYRSPDAKSVWIRDYSDMIRGARFFEEDVKSVVQHFADTQGTNGRIFDYFTTFPEKEPCEKENWTKYVRVPVEADVEYRFIKAAWICFQASDDSRWLSDIYPHMERAAYYSMNDPQRWEPGKDLIKRPYTIDTWDFAFTAGKHNWLQFQIDQDTYWGIFHGDNSGLFEALTILAEAGEILGQQDKVKIYREKANKIKRSLNATCWNGRYYTHFVKLSTMQIQGVREDQQLSLSNPMSLNRGTGTPEQAAAMIREYQFRQTGTDTFAPWFSIDPPFPDGIFGDEKLIAGAYINGGIFPLAGGELSLLALENGFEQYGFAQIQQYEELTRNNETYLWYFPNGQPSTLSTSTSPDATPTDGWGSSAFLHAIIQGVAGIRDLSAGFRKISFSPRWTALESRKATVQLAYPASGKKLEYHYEMHDQLIEYQLSGAFEEIQAHIFIPESHRVHEISVNGTIILSREVVVNGSVYADFNLANIQEVHIKIFLDKMTPWR